MRRLLRLLEIVDERLRVLGRVINDAAKRTAQVRIVHIEPLRDELRVVMVLRKDDRLAYPIACGDVNAVRHQILKDFVHRVGIEQPVVERRRGDLIRRSSGVLRPLKVIPLCFLLVGEIVVPDSFRREFERHRNGAWWYKVLIANRLVERIGVGRHAALKLEEAVGVAVDLVFRGRGETDEQAIEVCEDRAELAVDRAVRLVDYDEIKVSRAEASDTAARAFNYVHYGRVR